MMLLDGSRQIGSLAPTSVFIRAAAADLPDEWPVPVRMFIIWLTVILRMRDGGGCCGRSLRCGGRWRTRTSDLVRVKHAL